MRTLQTKVSRSGTSSAHAAGLATFLRVETQGTRTAVSEPSFRGDTGHSLIFPVQVFGPFPTFPDKEPLTPVSFSLVVADLKLR